MPTLLELELMFDELLGVKRYLSDEEAKKECPDMLVLKYKMQAEDPYTTYYVVQKQDGSYSVLSSCKFLSP